MSLKFEPSIIMTVRSANPRLRFLVDCLQYAEEERPPASLVSRGLQQCVLQIQRENRGPAAAQVSSILFPGMRVAINSSKTRRQQILDPLVKQQIEWNVKQEAGFKRRAVMVGIRNYLGREFKSLTVTSVNDVKDMTSALQDGGFGLENTYEDVGSREHFEEILRTYVDAVNKEPEEIEMLVFYYAGLGIQGLPRKLARKRRLGIFLDRVGISHDLALVTSNESLFPVAKLQTILAELNAKVKRKVLVLDIRFAKQRNRHLTLDPFSTVTASSQDVQIESDNGNRHKWSSDNSTACDIGTDWEVPIIDEEALDRLTTMFTIYTTAESSVPAVACDSHPRRTNGFLTGCLLNVLRDYVRPTIEELPGILNVEMDTEKDRAKAFTGIECKADFIPAGSNIWMLPFLTKN